MQATLIAKPFHREDWVYEEKVDGYRMVAYKDGDRVHLISRQGKDHTRRFLGLAYARLSWGNTPWSPAGLFRPCRGGDRNRGVMGIEPNHEWSVCAPFASG